MGRRGPRPTPSAIKQARGTYRSDRAAGNEAKPIGTPKCPAWLNADAKKEFRRLVKVLGGMGLLGEADQNALARYASTWVRWRQALQMIEKGGEVTVYKDENGRVKAVQPAAFAAIARGLAEQLDKLEASFGMTPSARSRIEVAPPPVVATPTEAKSRFFAGLN
jgi:P27 family predicted phage terminase small subunit